MTMLLLLIALLLAVGPATPPASASTIQTFAGTGTPALGAENVAPTASELYLPQDVTVGPDGAVYIADWNNHRIRVVENGLIRTIIGTGILGDAPEGDALSIGLNHPTNVSFGPDGNLYVAAWHNSKILKYDTQTHYVTIVCDSSGGRGWDGDGGPAYHALVNLPSSTDWGPDGNLYISDQSNHCVRMIDVSTPDNIITTVVAIAHTPGFGGDGGPASAAYLHGEVGQAAAPSSHLVFGPSGNLYLADTVNNRIRKVDTNGIITTIAGNGVAGFGGDGADALAASLNYPVDVAIGPLDGNLYIADRYNHRIRMVDLGTHIITTVVGTGTAGYSGDGGEATSAEIFEPYGIDFDAQGALYIADTKNHVIRVVEPQALPVDSRSWGTIKDMFRGSPKPEKSD
jgi:sugar lactone lactonase YvrE